MNEYKIVKIQENPELKNDAAQWFHSKWKIPLEAYIESMEDCINNQNAVPQWYVILDENKIIAGLGVIENDFHDRKDLTPNVCAVYVEKEYRRRGIAGEMLDFVCKDMQTKGIDTLYLLTGNVGFYERYNWELFCMVQEDRMYVHKEM